MKSERAFVSVLENTLGLSSVLRTMLGWPSGLKANRVECLVIVVICGFEPRLVGSGILELTSDDLCTLLLYGNEEFDTVTNRGIIEATVQFIKRSERRATTNSFNQQ